MAKIKLGFDTKEAQSGFDVIEPGLYVAKIKKVEQAESAAGNPMLVVSFQLTKDKRNGAFKGASIRTWVALTKAADFKVKEFQLAVGQKPGKSIDLDVDGKLVQIRVVADTYNGEPSAKVGKILALPTEDDDEDEDADDEEAESEDDDADDEDESDEDEDEESDEDDDSEDDEDAEDDDDEAEDYSEWSLVELRKELKSRNLDANGKSKVVLAARLLKDDEDDEDEDDPF